MRSYFATETEAAFRRCESERAVAAAERAVQGRPKNARKRWSRLPPGRSPQASLSPGSRRGSCGQWLAARDRFVTLPPHRRDTPPLPFAHRSPPAGVPSRRQTAALGRSTQLLGLILGTLGGADIARAGRPAVAGPCGVPIADAPDNARRGSCRNLRQYRDRIPGQGKYRIKTGPRSRSGSAPCRRSSASPGGRVRRRSMRAKPRSTSGWPESSSTSTATSRAGGTSR